MNDATNSTNNNESDLRCLRDIMRVYRDKNMYINQKNYTLRTIENLHKLGYYRSIESLFLD